MHAMYYHKPTLGQALAQSQRSVIKAKTIFESAMRYCEHWKLLRFYISIQPRWAYLYVLKHTLEQRAFLAQHNRTVMVVHVLQWWHKNPYANNPVMVLYIENHYILANNNSCERYTPYAGDMECCYSWMKNFQFRKLKSSRSSYRLVVSYSFVSNWRTKFRNETQVEVSVLCFILNSGG